MIKLTKFKTKDHEFVLNADLIETVDETPDTVITLVNGNKVLVEESMDDIIRLVIAYRRDIQRFGRSPAGELFSEQPGRDKLWLMK